MRERDERRALQERVLAVRDEVEADLKASIPGVVGVGVGFKERHGELTEEVVFRVYVKQKRPLAEVPPGQRVPDEIRGIPTDVLTLPEDHVEDDTDKYRPVKGGIQIGNGTGSIGTLGCLARRDSDGAIVALSNQHVMFAGGAGVGSDIGQPDYSDSCCCGCNGIGKVLAGSVGGTVDCAISSIDADVGRVHEIVEIGAVAGVATVVVGDAVRKRGRTTGLTNGTITDVSAPATSDAGDSFTDQLRIAVAAPSTDWSDGGDSGSAVVDSSNRVVGLHWGGVGTGGVACKIQNVQTELAITVPASIGELREGLQLAAPGPRNRPPIPGPRGWESVVDRYLYDDLPVGRAFRRHRAEIWGLIQQRRAVTVTWHRRQGPAFVAAFHRTATTDGYRVPEEIHDVSFAGLLFSMAAALEEHGSPGLRRDVRRYGGDLVARLQDCRTATELLAAAEDVEALLEPEPAGSQG